MSSPDESILDILDELIDIVTNARSVPMSASAMVNRAHVLDLLQTARASVPGQIVEADGLLANADSVTTGAHNDADRIRERADREQASRLVSEDAVTVSAKAQAQKIVDEAKTHSDRLIYGANDYSDNTLRELQEQVADLGNSLDELASGVQNHIDVLLGQIQAGRNVIATRRGDIDPEDGAVEVEEDSWT